MATTLNSIEPALPERQWLECPSKDQQSVVKGSTFKLLQFNTLADALAHQHSETSFIKSPISSLQWDYRGPRIIQEILRSGADIVCLEEVDHYGDYFKPMLAEHSFDGFFLPKDKSPCLDYPHNNGPDGCAMFFRRQQFHLLRKKYVVLKDTEGDNSHQVALLAEFQRKRSDASLASPCSVTVAMAHFKAKSEGKTLRAAQGKHLIEEASKFSSPGQPVIIAGDFNANVEEDVYKHFSDNSSHPELKLESSYKVHQYDNEEPPFTSWKFRAKGEAKRTIDYIWYTPETLCVEEVWGVPEEAAIGEDALPCAVYPSDHVALCTSFIFREKDTTA